MPSSKRSKSSAGKSTKRKSRATVSGPAEPEPHVAMPQAASAHDTFWALASLMPEITPMLMWAMSDRVAGRIHSYVDTRISRLGGPNFHEIPINTPVAPVHNNQRADHDTHATLFWNSRTDVEKTHIINAFRFELSKVQTPAVRERMVAGLVHVATELAEAVAAGLGMREVPAPLPKVLETDVTPEVTASPALSLFSRPGAAGVQTRRVAVLVADGVDVEGVQPLLDRLIVEGAVPRLLGPQLGAITTTAGASRDIDAPIDAMPPVLWDAVIVPDGGKTDPRLADGRVLEFLKGQFRHSKPLLVIGSAQQLLSKAGIPSALPDGAADPGLLTPPADDISIDGFMAALTKPRHFERETDPPRV